MAGQHWGERGNPGDPVSSINRLVESVCVGVSILACVGQIWYGVAILLGR
jgi:hypothetical protein